MISTRLAYMWSATDIEIEIDLVEDPVAILVILTPIGVLEVIGSFSLVERVLYIDRAHVQGLSVGSLGRAGLNAIGRKLLEIADVDQIVVQGGIRTTGRNKGKLPRPIRFPHR